MKEPIRQGPRQIPAIRRLFRRIGCCDDAHTFGQLHRPHAPFKDHTKKSSLHRRGSRAQFIQK